MVASVAPQSKKPYSLGRRVEEGNVEYPQIKQFHSMASACIVSSISFYRISDELMVLLVDTLT